MVMTSFKNTVLIFLLAGTMTALDAAADKVVLKDGTFEESVRVWETDRFVHFILKGTRSVEIRYAKEIVDHIENADGIARPVHAQKNVAAPEPAPGGPTPPPTNVSHKPNKSAHPALSEKADQANRSNLLQLDRTFIERNRNQTFYDPRRPQRYWADRQSQHADYAAAISVLAAQYNHPVDWIEKHMGQENDLGAIHASLIAAAEAEAMPDQNQSDSARATQSTQNQSTPDPSEDKKAQVIQRQPQEPPPAPPKATEGVPAPVQPIPPGIAFYDPRRPEKYWASPKDHCASLQEAVQLLAKVYGVSASHIESNLGESNDLSEIHASIQKSLGMVQKH